MSIQTSINQIQKRFKPMRIEIPSEEIETRLNKLIKEFFVPPKEAQKSVLNYFLKEHGLSGQAPSETVKIGDIEEGHTRVTIEKAKVVELWESSSDKIAQVGLIGDETGTIRFVLWAGSNKEPLVENQVYCLKDCLTSEWNGRYSVLMPKSSEIYKVADDVEVKHKDFTGYGVIVDILKNSGLIKRCPECNKALIKGECTEHGRVQGYSDLRITAVFDNGTITRNIWLDKDHTEEITKITLEEAEKMALEYMDTSLIMLEMKEKLVGRYFEVYGRDLTNVVLIDRIAFAPPPAKETLDELKEMI